MSIEQKIYNYSLIPVVTLEDKNKAISLGKTLEKSGLNIAEITFRTNAAADVIKILKAEFPSITIGAGTVLTISQAASAIEAGAEFIVTPCFDEDVVDYCLSKNIPIYPGILTPTELNLALKKGINIVKFFPSESFGGIKTINAISAPFKNVKFIPTGGINLNNLELYLLSDKVLACGGTWLTKKEYLDNDRFDLIEKEIIEAVKIIKKVR